MRLPATVSKMRRVWAATLALCAAADLRIETDVSLEVMMDDSPKTLRARLDEDPETAARTFCAAAAVAVDCEERVTKALKAEQDAVRVRTNQITPEEPPKRLPRRQAPPRKEPDAMATSATVSVSIVVDGRGFQIEAGIDEAPAAAAARFCRERNVTPRDCNVISLALAEKQTEARAGRRGSDDRAADLARQKLDHDEEGWGDHLFSGAASDEAPPPVKHDVADDATSIDYSVRVPPSLRVTFRGRDGEVVVERYLGETAEAAVARARAAPPRRVTGRMRRPAERLRVQGDAVRGLRGRPGAQGRGAGAPSASAGSRRSRRSLARWRSRTSSTGLPRLVCVVVIFCFARRRGGCQTHCSSVARSIGATLPCVAAWTLLLPCYVFTMGCAAAPLSGSFSWARTRALKLNVKKRALRYSAITAVYGLQASCTTRRPGQRRQRHIMLLETTMGPRARVRPKRVSDVPTSGGGRSGGAIPRGDVLTTPPSRHRREASTPSARLTCVL